MELILVGLIGAFIYLGPDDFSQLLPNKEEPQKQEEVVQAANQGDKLSNLSGQYDPLDPDSMYVAPTIDSVVVAEEEEKPSVIGKAGEKIKEITKPLTTWYEKIEFENKARAERHTFVRNRDQLVR